VRIHQSRKDKKPACSGKPEFKIFARDILGKRASISHSRSAQLTEHIYSIRLQAGRAKICSGLIQVQNTAFLCQLEALF